MEIKDRLYNLRKEKRFTLEEVGKKIGVSKQTISRYENGEIENIPYEKIVALAAVYGVSPGYIVGWEDESVMFSKDSANMLMDILEKPELALLMQTVIDLPEEYIEKVLKYTMLLSTYKSSDDSNNKN